MLPAFASERASPDVYVVLSARFKKTARLALPNFVAKPSGFRSAIRLTPSGSEAALTILKFPPKKQKDPSSGDPGGSCGFVDILFSCGSDVFVCTKVSFEPYRKMCVTFLFLPFQSGNMQILPLKALSAGALQIGGLLDLQKCDYLSQPCLKLLSVAHRAEGWQPRYTAEANIGIRDCPVRKTTGEKSQAPK